MYIVRILTTGHIRTFICLYLCQQNHAIWESCAYFTEFPQTTHPNPNLGTNNTAAHTHT